jgi:YD repeat-containing protein
VSIYDASADNLAANGANGLATRTERVVQLYSQTAYDAFGDAVATRDLAGNVSYTAYDKAGRSVYDVDPLGNVTGYVRDSFGDAISTTRYAATPSLATSMSNPPDAQAIKLALDAVPSHDDDRTIQTSYDRLGRAVQVTEPQVWVNNGVQGMFASKVTRNIYNAFGELSQQAVLADAANDSWAISTNYYDRDGRNVGTSDPMGYVTTRSFDASGNVTRVTEYANASVPGSVDLVLPTESADDRTTVYAYDAANRLTSQTRLHVQFSDGTNDVATGSRSYGDVTTRYEYDALGNRTAVIDALGGRTYTTFDALGHISSVSRPAVVGQDGALQPLTVYQRDALGRVVATISYASGSAAASSADDRISLAQYDSFGDVTQLRDANGVNHFASYDAGQHLRKQWQGVTGSDGREHTLFTAYEYDAAGRMTASITPGSNVVFNAADGTIQTVDQSTVAAVRSDTVYNAFGEVVRQGVEGGQQTTFSYDKAGRKWRTTSGNGDTKVTLFDLQGNQTGVLASAGMASSAIYGDADPLAGVAGADQADKLTGLRRTDMALDLLGRATAIVLPERDGVRPVVHQTYDRWGNLLSQSTLNGVGSVNVYRYNANNQLLSKSEPGGNGQQSASSLVTSYFYDRLGRQIAVRDRNGNVSAKTYDGAGDLVEERHADGGVVTHYYNAFGEESARRDAENNLSTLTRDHLGRVVSTSSDPVETATIDANGVLNETVQRLTTDTRYDEAGRVVARTDSAGATTSYDIDLRGNVTATHQPMGETDSAAFDAQGNRVAHIDANGALETWGYDANGRLQAHTDIGGAAYAYKYDSAGQLVEETNTRGKDIRTTYDGAGQVTQLRDLATDKTTQYVYNLAGQHTRELTVQGGQLLQDNLLAYDAHGRLARIDGREDQVSVLLEYDNEGNLLHQHEAQQAHDAGEVLGQVTIDGTVQVVSRALASSQGSSQDLWYAYDAMNRQVMIEGAANGNVDDANNLTEGQGHLVTYDKNGNRTSDTYQGSQLVAQIGADGATSYVVHQGRITVHYRYDAAGRLSETAVGAIDAQGNALDASYATVVSQNHYDAAGRLIQTGGGDKLPAGYVQAAAGNEGAAFDTDRIVRDYDADGRLRRERVTDQSGVLVRDTSYADGYDGVGNVLSYTVTDGTGNVSDTRISYIRKAGYSRAGIVTTRTAPNGVSVSTGSSYAYDVNGGLTRTDTTSAQGAVSTLTQASDFDGNILQTNDGNAVWDRLVVNGQVYAVWDPPSINPTDGAHIVDYLYWTYLNRLPSQNELDLWVGRFAQGTATPDDLYNELTGNQPSSGGTGSTGGTDTSGTGGTSTGGTSTGGTGTGGTSTGGTSDTGTGSTGGTDTGGTSTGSTGDTSGGTSGTSTGGTTDTGTGGTSDTGTGSTGGTDTGGTSTGSTGDTSGGTSGTSTGGTSNTGTGGTSDTGTGSTGSTDTGGTSTGSTGDTSGGTSGTSTGGTTDTGTGGTSDTGTGSTSGTDTGGTSTGSTGDTTGGTSGTSTGGTTDTGTGGTSDTGTGSTSGTDTGGTSTGSTGDTTGGTSGTSTGGTTDTGTGGTSDTGTGSTSATDTGGTSTGSTGDTSGGTGTSSGGTSDTGTGGTGDTTPPPAPGPSAADLVTEAYQSLLGRTPTASEVSYWTGAMANGMSITSVQAQMQSSPEYENRQATRPDTGNFDALGNVVVNHHPGDTLQGLAQTAYGDPSLGFIIAKANGITSDADIAKLRTISIPPYAAATTSSAGPAPTTTGGTSPEAMFAGWSDRDIIGYIMLHVPAMSTDASTPTERYVRAFDIYQRLQNGENQPGFAGMDYMEILTKLNGFYAHHTPDPLEMPGTTSFSYLSGPASAADVASRSAEYGAFNRSTFAEIDSAPTPTFAEDSSARIAENPLLSEMYGPNRSTYLRNSDDGADQSSAPSMPSIGSLTQDYSAVPDLTAADLALPKVDLGFLADLSDLNSVGADALRGGSEDTSGATQPSNSNQAGGDANGLIDLGDGRVQLPSGRIVRPNVTATVLDGEGNNATSTSATGADAVKPLYVNKAGQPIYSGSGGDSFYGLARYTPYEVEGAPGWARPKGGSLTYVFDSAGTPFWRVNDTIMSIPAPYARPELIDLEAGALWAGIKDGVTSLPGAVMSGVSDLVHGRVTLDGFLNGIYQNSPLGILGAMADENYYGAGQRAVGVAAGLATGYAAEFGLEALGRGFGNMRNVANEFAPDVSLSPFGESLSLGNSIEVPLSQTEIESIKAMPRGERPNPTDYLPSDYIDTHLQQFDKGGSRLTPKWALDDPPIGFGNKLLGRPDGEFLMPTSQMDDLLTRTNGDSALLEKELGLKPGSLDGVELVRIDVPDPRSLGLRMPSGNESGANPHWIPAGKLPTGYSEAVVNPIPIGSYIQSDLGLSMFADNLGTPVSFSSDGSAPLTFTQDMAERIAANPLADALNKINHRGLNDDSYGFAVNGGTQDQLSENVLSRGDIGVTSSTTGSFEFSTERLKLFDQYEATRVGVEREMFQTPNDELSVVISRNTGAEVLRELVPGTGGRLSPEVLENMHGNTFTHFHPLGGNFSPSDILTGLSQGAAEIRAVMDGRTVSINLEAAPSGLIGNPSAAYDFINGEKNAISQSFRSGTENGTLSPPSDLIARNIWLSDYFVQQFVRRNHWIKYAETYQ